MPFKDLLVHLDSSRQGAQRLAYAVEWAARDHAHLTGLYTLDLVPALAELARAYPGRIDQFDTYLKMHAAELDRAKTVGDQFRRALLGAEVEGEWRFVEGDPATTVALHARYADLTIVGQTDPANPGTGTNRFIPEKTLLTAGRPLVIIPYAGQFRSIGRKVVIGWKPTREAARALADALPILEQAENVTILTVNPDRGPDSEVGVAVADIALHLARHGVRVEARTTVAEDVETGDVLLNEVADQGADLLVIGGYGHPRLGEAIFGGVTQLVLEAMTVPVLLSH
jgi:nucleotide-binding universal stress UspA family protein